MEKPAKENYIFGKQNYLLLMLGVGLLLIGFLLMIGGGSDDPTKFSEELFNTQRITVSPLIILSGFTVVIFAIMRKTKA